MGAIAAFRLGSNGGLLTVGMRKRKQPSPAPKKWPSKQSGAWGSPCTCRAPRWPQQNKGGNICPRSFEPIVCQHKHDDHDGRADRQMEEERTNERTNDPPLLRRRAWRLQSLRRRWALLPCCSKMTTRALSKHAAQFTAPRSVPLQKAIGVFCSQGIADILDLS